MPKQFMDIDNYLELMCPEQDGLCFGMSLLSLLLYDEDLLPGPYFEIPEDVWGKIDALRQKISNQYSKYPEERFFTDIITLEIVKQLHETQDVDKARLKYLEI